MNRVLCQTVTQDSVQGKTMKMKNCPSVLIRLLRIIRGSVARQLAGIGSVPAA